MKYLMMLLAVMLVGCGQAKEEAVQQAAPTESKAIQYIEELKVVKDKYRIAKKERIESVKESQKFIDKLKAEQDEFVAKIVKKYKDEMIGESLPEECYAEIERYTKNSEAKNKSKGERTIEAMAEAGELVESLELEIEMLELKIKHADGG